MSVIVNVGVLIWIIVIPFLVGMTIGAAVMLANSGAVKFSSPDLPIADLKAIAQLFE